MISIMDSALESLHNWLDRRWADRCRRALLDEFTTRENAIPRGARGHFDCYAVDTAIPAVDLVPLHGFGRHLGQRVSVTRSLSGLQARLQERAKGPWRLLGERHFMSRPAPVEQIAKWALAALAQRVEQLDERLEGSFMRSGLSLQFFSWDPIAEASGSAGVYMVVESDVSRTARKARLAPRVSCQLLVAEPSSMTADDGFFELHGQLLDGTWAAIGRSPLTPDTSTEEMARLVRDWMID